MIDPDRAREQLSDELTVIRRHVVELEVLKEEIDRRNRDLSALHRASQAIISTLELDEVLARVMTEARTILEAEATSVLLYDPHSDELFFAAVAGAGSETLTGIRMPASAGIAGWVIREARPALITDVQKDPRFYDHIDAVTSLTTHSLLAVPLRYKEQAIGVVEAINKRGHAFDEHDLTLLSTLAGPAAIAIEHARLYKETTRRLAETRVLQEVMLAAASTLDFDEMLTRAIQAIHHALHIEYLSLLLPDESEEHLIAHPSLIGFAAPSEGGLRLPMGQSVCGRVYTTGQSELIDDIAQIACYFECTPGLRSELAVPVRVGDRVIAVLNAESPQPKAFTADDLRIFQAIAAQLGVMMENARLYNAEQELRRLVEQSWGQLIQSERLAATGRLVGSLAHEINNPLQALHNSLQILLTFSLKPDEQQEYLEMANEEIRRLINLTGYMLDFARHPGPEVRPTDLNTTIEKTLALTGKYLQHSRIVLRRDLAPDLPPVLATPGELEQVFLNLVLNAVDAMPEGGTLHVSSHRDKDGYLTASFSDTGHGIPPEHQDRLFKAFFSTKDGGTGLGLFISRHIVERYGGEITMQSEVGEGTTFTVRLPDYSRVR